MIQVSNNAGAYSYYTGDRQHKQVSPKTTFRENLESQTERPQNTSITKEDILKKFPSLSEQDLDCIIKNNNIENMNSSELYKLAEELMDKKVIPSYPHDSGLELIAVFPKSLYDAILSGDKSMLSGSVTVAPDYLYTVNQNKTVLTYHGYPEFGLKNIQYGIQLTQNALKDYDSYYTRQERERALLIEESKKAFYDLADMIVKYQKN